MPGDDVARLTARLRAAWDDEVRAEPLARRLLALGPDGVDSLMAVLRDSTRRHPKASVAVLNAIHGSVTPYVRERLRELMPEGVLSHEDQTYLVSILGEFDPTDSKTRSDLVRALESVRDPTDRGEILVNIVKLQILEARPVLERMLDRTDLRRPSHEQAPEETVEHERVVLALWALQGRLGELEQIAFDHTNHAYRRVLALDYLALSLGNKSEDVLRKALRDADRHFRKTALELVGELGLVGSLDLVETGLCDPDPWVVQQSAYAIRDLAAISTFTADLDRVRQLRARVLESLKVREGSSERTDRQILVPVLRKTSALLGRLLRTPD